MSQLVPFPIDRLPTIGPAAICMGVFDGVHLGHRALAEATIDAAARHGAQSVALVFDPHPDEVVRPGTVVPRLAPLADNLLRLEQAGIDRALPVLFDAALRGLTAEEFLAALAQSIALRALVMTPASAFGRNRAGTPDAMRAHGRTEGFDLVLAEPVIDGGSPISSARVRAALAAGNLSEATRLLGHPPFLAPVAVDADGGSARLRFAYAPALPAAGRYLAVLHGADEASGSAREAMLTIDESGAAGLNVPIPANPGGPISLELRSRL